MTELAPWESEGSRAPYHPDSPTAPVYKLPARLPDVYKAHTHAFVKHAGETVNVPPMTPRPLQPRAKLALMALIGGVVLGLLWVAFVFLMFGSEAGFARYIYAGIGGALSLACVVVLLLELPRIRAYRRAEFIPGILVYGSRSAIEKITGTAGITSLTSRVFRGTGAGILNKVFDRSKHSSSPPEVVALHINTGHEPELVGIEWSAVYEHQRGDIVWYRPVGVGTLQMFHKLIPYAPWTAHDEATRREIYTGLKVGAIKRRDRQDTQNMGNTKRLDTDRDGKLVSEDAVTKKQQPVGESKGGKTKDLGLSPQGKRLGGDDQFVPQDEYGTEPEEDADTGPELKLTDPDKSLGGQQQPEEEERPDEQ